jgi:RND superfamily putative drug exporter
VLAISSTRYKASDPVFRGAVATAVAAVQRVDARILVLPPGVPGGGEISRDGAVATANVSLRGDAGQRQDVSKRVQAALARAMPAGVSAGLTGNSPLLADLTHVEEQEMLGAEVVGLPIAALILLIAFGSAVAAGLPMLLGISGLLVSFGAIAGFMLFRDFNAFVESLMAMIGLAIGIDYALLFVRRFREERSKADAPEEAIARTLATAGRTIAFSGAILSTSLVPLVITNLPFFGDTAFAVIVVVLIEVMLVLTFLPAVLLKLGSRVDKWSLPGLGRRRRASGAAGDRFGGPVVGTSGWYRWAKAVMRRPWPIFIGGVALLLFLATPVLHVKTGVDLNARAMKGEPSVRPLTALEQHFPAAALEPVEVLVQARRGDLAASTARAEATLRADRRLADVRRTPIARRASLLLATPRVGVDTPAAEQLVRDIRVQLTGAVGPSATTQVTGVTAQTVDYTDETNRVTPWVITVALLLSFSLLLWLFRSPVLAAKAILMNLLSIGAAFGLTVFVFQQGHGQGLLGFTSPGYIQSWMPLTLFMVLFGLSMDYEVFMVSRIREEWEKGSDTVEAVARGLERTGGVVTSAATIMVAIFASFLLVSIPEMKQTGFGLAVAVLIDATVVRAMLVPAFMRIAGNWNWWMPGRLDRLLPKLEH